MAPSQFRINGVSLTRAPDNLKTGLDKPRVERPMHMCGTASGRGAGVRLAAAHAGTSRAVVPGCAGLARR